MRKENKRAGRKILGMMAAAVMAALLCVPAWGEELTGEPETEGPSPAVAAGWNRVGDLWYYGDGAGVLQTGWIQAEDGLWYYLDTETGSWVPRPLLDKTASVHLLENAIARLGYYDREEYPVEVCENWRSDTMIHMSVRIITGPNSYSTLNTYQVDKRTGRVNPAVGEDFNLYD